MSCFIWVMYYVYGSSFHKLLSKEILLQTLIKAEGECIMSISVIRTKWCRDRDLVEGFHPIPLLLSAGWSGLLDIEEGNKALKAIDELLTEASKGSK